MYLMQTRRASLLESIANTSSGFVISWAVWALIVGPLYGIEKRTGDDLGIVAIFTVASLVRGFVLRRFFNRWGVRGR